MYRYTGAYILLTATIIALTWLGIGLAVIPTTHEGQ